MKPFICITGGIACGKSTISRYLFDVLEYLWIDADAICHVLLSKENIIQQIVDIFGDEVIEIIEGLRYINHKIMGKIAFQDIDKKKKLEAILHPLVEKKVDNIRKHCHDVEIPFAYECPLLFEIQKEEKYLPIIVVTCDKELQIKRLMERNGLSADEAQLRIDAQLPIEYKISKADYVIDTSREFDSTELTKFLEVS